MYLDLVCLFVWLVGWFMFYFIFSAVRKINELVKRVRICKVHAYIIAHLKEQMPMMMGHSKKQRELIDDLPKVFRSVMKKYNLAPGDFPDLDDFRSKLQEQDFSRFAKLKQPMLDEVETVLGIDIPRLMEALPRSAESSASSQAIANAPLIYDAPAVAVTGTAGDDNPWASDDNPFGDDNDSWGLQEYVGNYQPQFDKIQSGGLVTGAAAKSVLSASGLPTPALRKIWNLSDLDKDGRLDLKEFVIAMFLIDMVKQGNEVPEVLDAAMIPPEKKH